MAFTFSQTNVDNLVSAGDLSISINPDTAMFAEVLDAGESAAGQFAVENTGPAHAQLFLSADWGPSAATTDREATLVASALATTVTVSSDANAIPDTTVYSGRLIDLIDVPVFTLLSAGTVADVKISVTMPADRSGPTLMDKGIRTDLVLVAVSTA